MIFYRTNTADDTRPTAAQFDQNTKYVETVNFDQKYV